MKKITRPADNRGFSLVELIVSMLIMSVIMLIVIMLISSSRATYNSVKTDAVLQTESDVVKGFINELAIEATAWGHGTYGGSPVPNFIWLKSPDNDYDATGVNRVYFYYVFYLDENQQLRYGKYDGADVLGTDGKVFGTGFTAFTKDSGDKYGIKILTDPYAVLAEHVVSINCQDSTDKRDQELISIDVEYSFNDTGFNTTMNYAGRNRQQDTTTPTPDPVPGP